MSKEIECFLKDRIDFSKIRRVLVVKLRHHGDVLLTSPVFQILKNHYPHLDIDALVYKDTEEMLSLHPSIDQLHTIDRRWKTLGLSVQLTEELRLLNKLKHRNYDLLIHLTEHQRGLIIKQYCRIPKAVSASYPRRNNALWRWTFKYLHPVFPMGKRHRVEQHLDALRRIGVQPAGNERQLVLEVGKEARKKVDSIMAREGVGARSYVHIHPTSRWLFKTWDHEKFAHVIDRLAGAGKQVVLTSSPDKQELLMIDAILAKTKSKPINLCGKLTLKELAGVIESANVFLGVDSVPMHMAAALNAPVVALFGPSDPVEWGPWCAKKIILTSDLFPCRPCGVDGCGGGKRRECLSDLTVKQVLLALEKVLQ